MKELRMLSPLSEKHDVFWVTERTGILRKQIIIWCRPVQRIFLC